MVNLRQIEADANRLVEHGRDLLRDLVDKDKSDRSPRARSEYQDWYSNSLAVMRAIAPDRIDEFTDLYRPNRRSGVELTIVNYGISDWLQGIGLRRENSGSVVYGKFITQWRILTSVVRRLDSAIADIEGTLRASMFDNEIDQAQELLDKDHVRAAGALAGVVLESHLAAVCSSHQVSLGRKKKTIGNLKDALKSSGTIDLPVARQIEALADVRNLCGHKRGREPTSEEVQRLIDHTRRYTKELS